MGGGGLRGGGVQVGQPHVGGVLGRGQLVHGRDEAVRLLVHVVQEADDADVGPHAHRGELRLGVSVVLRAVLLLLRGSRRRQRDDNADERRPGGSVLVTTGQKTRQYGPPECTAVVCRPA